MPSLTKTAISPSITAAKLSFACFEKKRRSAALFCRSIVRNKHLIGDSGCIMQ